MSSRGEEKSWIRPDNKLSIFTDHLLEALQGAANKPGDTDVKVSNLMNHLGKTVPVSVREAYQEEQTPFFDAASEDFPVALLYGGKGLPTGGWEAIREAAALERVRIVQASDHSVAIGGDVTGSTIITGVGDVVGGEE
jgi:hypothetical protein